MATRRTNQEGTINKLPSGRWRAQIVVDGVRLSHTEATRQACTAWLRTVDRTADHHPKLLGERKTFSAYLEEWLIIVKSNLRTSTYNTYRKQVTRYINPFLGHIMLKDLRSTHIQDLYDSLLKADLSAKTIQLVHSVIHNSLTQAVRLGLLQRNPTLATVTPKVTTPEMQFYDEAQVTQFLIAAQGDRNEVLYYIALYTGMRQSELLGLRWSDVDWQRQTIRVQRQLRRDFRKGQYFGPPKSRSGKRTVQLGANGIARLREQWQLQDLDRAAAGDRWQENDLIFASRFGTPMNHNSQIRHFKNLIKSAGLPEIRFHDLRHTAASMMLNHGIPPIIASRRLGHSKVSITLDTYGHLMPEMQSEVADLMDELITPIPIELPTATRAVHDTPHRTR